MKKTIILVAASVASVAACADDNTWWGFGPDGKASECQRIDNPLGLVLEKIDKPGKIIMMHQNEDGTQVIFYKTEAECRASKPVIFK